MSWIPRFPEVKANLVVTNGAFGTLISTGAFGGLASLFLTGHMVHKYGVKRVILANIWLMGLAYFLIVRTDSPGTFLICNIAIGWSASAYHISINAQSFSAIERIKEITIARLHGIWALGTLTTAIVSGLIVGFIPIQIHVGGLAIIVVILLTLFVLKLSPVLIKANQNDDEHLPMKTLFTSFKVDWLISGGLLCAVFLEFATGDWSAIFARERIGVSAGQAALPYICFMSAMIIGRFSASRLMQIFEIHRVIRFLALTGGVGFLLFLTISVNLPITQMNLALISTCLAFTFAGAGSSLMAPTFYTAGNRRTTLPSAVLVGRMGVVNVICVFILKACVAWTAQFTGSIALALTIPGLMLIAASLFANGVREP